MYLEAITNDVLPLALIIEYSIEYGLILKLIFSVTYLSLPFAPSFNSNNKLKERERMWEGICII
jgi:hypothetical protein